jgi:DNA-directed RNA polymerase subunit K/omega
MGAYQFAVLSSLRAAQLMHGCVPKVDIGTHKATTAAQLEISLGATAELLPETEE